MTGAGSRTSSPGRTRSIDTKAFDYWYYDESTDSKGHTTRTYYRFDCVVVPIDAACSPLTIENENVLTRLADALSFHDIEFESEDFNRMFNVKSPDKKFANDFIDARMMQWLLQNGKGTAFEVMGDRLLCYRRKLAPDGDRPAARARRRRSWITSRAVVYSLYARATADPCRGRERASRRRTRRSGLAGHYTPDAIPRGEPLAPPERRAKLARPLRKERP